MTPAAETTQARAWVDGIHHDARDENRDADRLANQAVDLRQPPPDWLEIETLAP